MMMEHYPSDQLRPSKFKRRCMRTALHLDGCVGVVAGRLWVFLPTLERVVHQSAIISAARRGRDGEDNSYYYYFFLPFQYGHRGTRAAGAPALEDPGSDAMMQSQNSFFPFSLVVVVVVSSSASVRQQPRTAYSAIGAGGTPVGELPRRGGAARKSLQTSCPIHVGSMHLPIDMAGTTKKRSGGGNEDP